MFPGTQEAHGQGWSILSVFVTDEDGPRRIEQTIRLLLKLSTASFGTETKPVEGVDDERGHLRPGINGSPRA
jgi:hypothetical protein